MSLRLHHRTAQDKGLIQRRQLVLAGLWGLPLTLAGCGGGGAGADGGSVNPPGEDLAADVPLGPDTGLPVAPLEVSFELPDGLTLPPGPLWVATASGQAQASGSRATVPVLSDSAELAGVFTADGTQILWGWVGHGLPPLSVRTTAQALLYHLAFMGAWRGPVAQGLRTALADWPATQTLAASLEAELRVDLTALHDMRPGLVSAISAALDAWTSGPAGRDRERPQGVLIDPAAWQGGLYLAQGSRLNTVFYENELMRRSVAFIDRVRYEKKSAAGAGYDFTPAPKPGAPLEIPMPKAFDSLGGVVASPLEDYLGNPGALATGYGRSATDEQTLEMPPDGQDRVRYSAVVLSVSDTLPSLDELSLLSETQRAYLIGLDPTVNLYFRFVFEDLLGPILLDLMFSGLKVKLAKGELDDLLKGIAKDLFELTRNDLAPVLQRFTEGQLTLSDFITLLLAKLAYDPATGKFSDYAWSAFKLVIQRAARFLRGPAARDVATQLGSAFTNGKSQSAALRRFAAMVPLFAILDGTDLVLKGMQAGRLRLDVHRSLPIVRHDVYATRARVNLTPSTSTIEPLQRVELKAEVVEADDPNETYVYIFTASGGPGVLIGNTEHGKKVTQSTPVITYYADTTQSGTPPETVKVEIYKGSLAQLGPRVGEASATVALKKLYNIQVTPASITLRPKGSIGLLASFKEVLPAGAKVSWEWQGDLSALTIPDQGGTPDGMASATYTAGDAEGMSTITVKAVITTLDGTQFEPDPVEVPVTVSKAAKTISFRVFTDSFAESKVDSAGNPYCSVTHVTWVPVVAGAASYTTSQVGCTDAFGCPYLSRSWTPTSHFDIGQRGGMWVYGMGGDSGGCHDTAQRVASGKARFASAVVTCTVTLAD